MLNYDTTMSMMVDLKNSTREPRVAPLCTSEPTNSKLENAKLHKWVWKTSTLINLIHFINQLESH